MGESVSIIARHIEHTVSVLREISGVSKQSIVNHCLLPKISDAHDGAPYSVLHAGGV